MPLVYADSSVLFAYFHPHDDFSELVDAAVQKNDFVAAARRLNLLNEVDAFWTCDAVQADLARSAGLKTRLFKLKRSAKE